MQNAAVFVALLRQYLPEFVRNKIDWKTIRLSNETFIDPDLKLCLTNIVYEVNIVGVPGYLAILIEHQRDPKRYMPIRLWHYALSCMRAHMGRYESKPPPIVYPMLFHQGKTSYQYSMDILDAFPDRELAANILFRAIDIIDLHAIPDEQLAKIPYAGLMQLLLKHTDTPDMKFVLRKVKMILNQVYISVNKNI